MNAKEWEALKEVFVPYFLEVNSDLKTTEIIRISCKLCLSFQSKEKFINSNVKVFKNLASFYLNEKIFYCFLNTTWWISSMFLGYDGGCFLENI